MDAEGAEACRPFYESAGATFTAAVDAQNAVGSAWGYELVPNAFMIDEAGILQDSLVGGFDVRNPRHAERLDAFLSRPAVAANAGAPLSDEVLLRRYRAALKEHPTSGLHLAIGQMELRGGKAKAAAKSFAESIRLNPQRSDAHFGHGSALLKLQRKGEGLAALKMALKLNPSNYIIRKQIWLIEHPERFHPKIDWAWQREQMQRERKQEAGG